uniref:Uncharacterized protein n=1 Tax=Cannabis sativa TaxID=3483 RepID=A0A803PVU8_CANSA
MNKEKDKMKDEVFMARGNDQATGKDQSRGRDPNIRDHSHGHHRSQSRSKPKGKYHKDMKCYFVKDSISIAEDTYKCSSNGDLHMVSNQRITKE